MESFSKVNIQHQCRIALDRNRLESYGLRLAPPDVAERVSRRHYIQVGISGFEANAGYSSSRYDHVSEYIGSLHDLPIALEYALAIWVPGAVYVRYHCSPRP
jgi:hypothetical protein